MRPAVLCALALVVPGLASAGHVCDFDAAGAALGPEGVFTAHVALREFGLLHVELYDTDGALAHDATFPIRISAVTAIGGMSDTEIFQNTDPAVDFLAAGDRIGPPCATKVQPMAGHWGELAIVFAKLL